MLTCLTSVGLMEAPRVSNLPNYEDIIEARHSTSDFMFMSRRWEPVPAYNHPNNSSPTHLKDVTLSSPPVQHMIHQLSSEEEGTSEQLTMTVAAMLEEIGLNRNMVVIRWLGLALIKILKRTCSGLLVSDSIHRLKARMGTNPVIFAPSHRSYADFILMSYICFHYDLQIPAIAAGMDFHGMWGLGRLLRDCGAFFMRRSFSSDRLYWTVFSEYVNTLVTNNPSSLEFFIEGTRSRSGKTLWPKFGILSMALTPFLSGRIPDITVIPVNISYDRTLEEKLFSYELLGIPKPRILSMALTPFLSGRIPDITVIPVNISYDRTLEEKLFSYELLGIPKPRETTRCSKNHLHPTPNLHNFLVYPNLPDPATNNNNKHQAKGSFPRNKPRCSNCQIHQPVTSSNCRLTHMKFLMKGHYDCHNATTALLNTLASPQKHPDNGLMKARNILREQYGKIHVTFGQPLDVREYCKERLERASHSMVPAHMDRLNPRETALCSELAHVIVARQRELTVLSPFNLVAITLGLGSSLPLPELLTEVLWLRSLLVSLGAVVDLAESGVSVEAVIKRSISVHSSLVTLTPCGMVQLTEVHSPDCTMDLTKVKGHNLSQQIMDAAIPVLMLQTYINPCLHYFINPAMVILILLQEQQITRDDLLLKYLELRRLLAHEFTLHGLWQEQCEHLDLVKAVSPTVLRLGGHHKLRSLLCHLLYPFLVGSLILCQVLLQVALDPCSERRVLQVTQQRAEQLLVSKETSHPYILCLEVYTCTLQSLVSLQAVHRIKRSGQVLFQGQEDKLHDIVQLLAGLVPTSILDKSASKPHQMHFRAKL
ncbi:unnamed protein product [Timema podura]|uniref:Phospholipid/glycerol acyltransferase domain-containing protein n=1 Tax=Timema podura TaxID=61482 RepID=A0ABN7NMN8_TIMPD|nr:unnamed protein product [Timema podura]